jgi:flagellar FliL protein
MSDAEKTEKTDAAAKPKKKSKLIPILAVVFVLLAGGGAGAYWMYSKRAAAAGGEASAKEERPPKSGVVDMEPFVVNLADESGKRFLRVNMKLLTWDEEQAAEMKEDAVVNAKVRAAILELLSLQYAAPLVTPEGKEELKKAIAERVAETSEELKVTDVLFVEFVVQ